MAAARCDHADRLTSLTYSFQNSNAAAPAYQWVYDNAGRVTDLYSWLDSSGTPSFGSVATWAHAQYNYDHADQLSTSGRRTVLDDQALGRQRGRESVDFFERWHNCVTRRYDNYDNASHPYENGYCRTVRQ